MAASLRQVESAHSLNRFSCDNRPLEGKVGLHCSCSRGGGGYSGHGKLGWQENAGRFRLGGGIPSLKHWPRKRGAQGRIDAVHPHGDRSGPGSSGCCLDVERGPIYPQGLGYT
eukprot:scaffold187084_cov36-Tisochrysis_lutea.AAC.2